MTEITLRPAKGPDAPAPAVDMTTTLAGAVFPNPVFTASGCAASGQELDQFFDISKLGAMVTKSIMTDARAGRPTPRMAETPSGMLNSIGLQGPGIESFLERDLPWLADRGARVIVSIAGHSVEEYAKLAQKLRARPGVAAIEVNISCPNVENRGLVFACDAGAASSVISAVKRSTAVPVFAKLSADVTDIVSIARACVVGGADGLTLINTMLGMVIDTTKMRPALAGVTGGLSGPAIRPIAVRCVWQVHQEMPDVPIIGVGGIRSGLDALEFILAGASAVSVGTAVFGDPHAPMRVLRELRQALSDRGIDDLSSAVGLAQRLSSADESEAEPPSDNGEGTEPEADTTEFAGAIDSDRP